MKEKLQTLPVSELRAIAAEKGIAQIYSLRKAELIEKLAALYEAEQNAAEKPAPEKSAPEKPAVEKPAVERPAPEKPAAEAKQALRVRRPAPEQDGSRV